MCCFAFSFLLSWPALFIILIALILAYYVSSELREKVGLLFFPFFLLMAFFVILKDERGMLIRKLEHKYDATKDTKILYQLASIYEFEGDISLVAETYLKIAEANPYDDTALTRLGIIMVHVGRKDLALEIFKTVLKINPSSHNAKLLLEMLGKGNKEPSSEK